MDLRKSVLTRPNLNQAYVSPEEVEVIMTRVGVYLGQQEVITLFRNAESKSCKKIKLTKLLKFIIESNI